jgi:hypothetical protein
LVTAAVAGLPDMEFMPPEADDEAAGLPVPELLPLTVLVPHAAVSTLRAATPIPARTRRVLCIAVPLSDR